MAPNRDDELLKGEFEGNNTYFDKKIRKGRVRKGGCDKKGQVCVKAFEGFWAGPKVRLIRIGGVSFRL